MLLRSNKHHHADAWVSFPQHSSPFFTTALGVCILPKGPIYVLFVDLSKASQSTNATTVPKINAMKNKLHLVLLKSTNWR